MTARRPSFDMLNSFAENASKEVNRQLLLPEWKDQSAGNQCHALTFHVMTALQYADIPVRRELHRDRFDNWHYVLAHTALDAMPTDDDLISDLNPWQWRPERMGSGPIHAPRGELMEILRRSGAPEFFIALRSLETVVKAHEPKLNFGGHV